MVGIEHEAYNVSEGDEYVEVCAILVRGIPTEPADITLTTFDGGAAGMLSLTSFTHSSVHTMIPCHPFCFLSSFKRLHQQSRGSCAGFCYHQIVCSDSNYR